jgi:hypothetical protein
MTKRIKVRYLQNVTSPPSQAGIEGEVKFLPVGIARGLIKGSYVIVVKDSVQKKRPKPGVRVVEP